MRIADTIDMGGDADFSVEMEIREEKSDRVRPFRVDLDVYVEERVVHRSTVTAKTKQEAADAAIDELQKWIGRLGALHASAVRMRRMLTKEDGQ